MAGSGGHGATLGAWVVTAVIIATFVVGGIALIVPAWWLFWVSAGVFVVAVIAGKLINMMDMVDEYDRPTLPSKPA